MTRATRKRRCTQHRPPRAWLAWLLAGAAAAASAAPFDVEVVVFTRRVDGYVSGGLATDNRPTCFLKAVTPRPPEAAPQLPFSLPETSRRLASEAATLGRRGSGLQILLHRAWRQEVGPERGGTWVRLDAAGLEGCVRIGGDPAPQAEWDIAFSRGSSEEYRVEGSRRLLPGDLHYIDHPAFGMLVRLDPADLEPPPSGAAVPALPTGDAAPGAIPPPPKKPFRW